MTESRLKSTIRLDDSVPFKQRKKITFNFFEGIDENGLITEIGLAWDCKTFCYRKLVYNGYGVSWQKWTYLKDKIKVTADVLEWKSIKYKGGVNFGIRVPTKTELERRGEIT
jgi:hypothetical protein